MSEPLQVGKIIALAKAGKPFRSKPLPAMDYSALVDQFLKALQEHDIRFTVVGGLALLQHVQGRNTEDIDLIVSRGRIENLPGLTVEDQNDMFAQANYHGLRVDLLFSEVPFFEKISDDFSQPKPYEAGPLSTASVEGLILLKLFALPSLYRQFDYDRIPIYEADITQLLARSEKPDAFFLDHLREHTPDTDLTEISQVLAECRERLRRMRRFEK